MIFMGQQHESWRILFDGVTLGKTLSISLLGCAEGKTDVNKLGSPDETSLSMTKGVVLGGYPEGDNDGNKLGTSDGNDVGTPLNPSLAYPDGVTLGKLLGISLGCTEPNKIKKRLSPGFVVGCCQRYFSA